jgi:hypothetical protein
MTQSSMCWLNKQVAAMPRGELAALWQQYLHAFAALLLQMRGDTQSAAAHRLVRMPCNRACRCSCCNTAQVRSAARGSRRSEHAAKERCLVPSVHRRVLCSRACS